MISNLPKLKNPAERIKFIRENLLKLSRAKIAKKYGLSADTLAAWENGKIAISEKGIQKCIKIFNAENLLVSREWILNGAGLNPNFSFEFRNYFRTLDVSQPEEKIDDTLLIAKEINYFMTLTSNSIIGLIVSDDMLPLYSQGDRVGGRYRYGKDISDCVGKDCIIMTKDGAKYIRRLAKNLNGKTYNLVCLNPEWGGNPEPIIFDVEVECVAPIIWHRRSDD